MNTLYNKLRAFGRNIHGATAIEYALIAGIISLAVVGGATLIGQSANAGFVSVDEQVWSDD